jgi:beta-galactosidase
LYFRDWSERDVKSMVERDCNHPSIILWSIGNEIPNRTQATAQRLKKWVQEIDTTRPVTMANAGGNSDTAVADELGAVGYNYYEKAYDADHKAHPDWVIFGSETSSAVRTRGVYHLPTDKNILEAPDLQCSCYDNSVVPWGKSAEQSWIDDRDRPFVAGQFIWTGFDYIGEPTPYGDNAKSSYFGIVDTCGFPKDIYYFYRSQWTDTPTVHLLPEWNGHQAGDKVPVWAYTNAHTVDLYLNGKSLGSKTYDPMGKKLHLEWEVPYDQGELKAVASDAQGKVIATDVVRTTGKPAAIVLKPDRSVIHKDGKDLSYVEVDVVDKDGNIVPDADDLIEFTVIGGKIAGVDNGNPISFESYKGHTRKAFHGKCLLVVQSGTDCSEITVAAETNGGKLSATPIHIKAE